MRPSKRMHRRWIWIQFCVKSHSVLQSVRHINKQMSNSLSSDFLCCPLPRPATRRTESQRIKTKTIKGPMVQAVAEQLVIFHNNPRRSCYYLLSGLFSIFVLLSVYLRNENALQMSSLFAPNSSLIFLGLFAWVIYVPRYWKNCLLFSVTMLLSVSCVVPTCANFLTWYPDALKQLFFLQTQMSSAKHTLLPRLKIPAVAFGPVTLRSPPSNSSMASAK